MRKIHNLFLASLFCSPFVISCGDEADIPIFLTVEQPGFNIPVNKGTDFHAINEYFLFHNSTLLGGFSYGHEIPVLADGDDLLQIFPSIRLNGLNEQPRRYLMMNSYDVTRSFVPGEVVIVQPSFSYQSNINCRIIEDFEAGTGFNMDLDGNAMTQLLIEGGQGFNNSKGGRLAVTVANPILSVAWSVGMRDFPAGGEVIVELSFLSEMDLGVGVFWEDAFLGPQFSNVAGFFPNSVWTKAYVDLGPTIREALTNANEIHLFFTVDVNSSSNDMAETFIDDIKLLHLQ